MKLDKIRVSPLPSDSPEIGIHVAGPRTFFGIHRKPPSSSIMGTLVAPWLRAWADKMDGRESYAIRFTDTHGLLERKDVHRALTNALDTAHSKLVDMAILAMSDDRVE